MDMRRFLPLLIGLLLAAGPAFAGDGGTAWRWVDQNGVVHFSDQPPPDAANAESLELPEYEIQTVPAYSYVALLERLRNLEAELDAVKRERQRQPTPAPVVIQPVATVERVVTPAFFPSFRHFPHHRDFPAPANQRPDSSFDRLFESRGGPAPPPPGG